MSVMVTGATGLIGMAVVRMLLENDGEGVVAFHRNPAKRNLDDLRDNISIVHGDLDVFSHVLEAVGKHRPRIIYHLGAMLTAPSDNDPPVAFQTNVAGMFYLLESARLYNVEQILFASSIGSYGLDIQGKIVDDYTLQRPTSMYGVSKLFGEGLGRYYRQKYGLDFRCIRYPGVLGPGFRTPSMARPFSYLIEESVAGRPYTLKMSPDVKHTLLYYKDAAPAMIKLAQAPEESVRMVCYLVKGAEPDLTVQEMVDMVISRIPEARLNFDPDPELTQIYYDMPSYDDRVAREEWGWKPEYDYATSLDDFISELRQFPGRYA
jgi:threonine 3-dehydrogenase